MKKSKVRILLSENVHPVSLQLFKQRGYTQVKITKKVFEKKELLQLAKEIQVLGIRSKTKIDAQFFREAKNFLALGTFTIGLDHIDLEASRKRSIPVFNAPFSSTRSVAELVMGEIIFLMRGIIQKHQLVRQGFWDKTADFAYEIREKILGIVGYGKIGSQVGLLAEMFGMQVFYYDIEKKLSFGKAQSLESLQDLLKKVDVLTLHVPKTPQTVNLIGEKELKLMRLGSFLINASRGEVVNIKALVKALKAKHLLGVAIDVFPKEPQSNKERFYSPLTRFDNVILTPHIGGSTEEAQKKIAQEVTEKLIDYLDKNLTDLNNKGKGNKLKD